MTFLQLVPGTDGETHDGITCYHCNKQGHYAGSCPKHTGNTDEGVQMLQVATPLAAPPPTAPPSWVRTSDTQESLQFLQAEPAPAPDDPYTSAFTFAQTAQHNLIPMSWILLDSQSTVSVFNNPNLLTNIRPSPRALRVHTNGGTPLPILMGTVPNFGDVWFTTGLLSNILSIAEVR